MSDRPLLMIPGPIEVSDAVRDAAGGPPPGHLAPALIEAFGASLGMLRRVWRASSDSQPFVLPGSGTSAMDSAVQNLCERGHRALLVNTGYFSDRMAEMLRRRGVTVTEVKAQPGEAPDAELVRGALASDRFDLLFATHVDTSTAVRVDAEGYARAAREHGVLSVFDGVCATAAERFEMEAWGADVYLTASQKAIGLPPGLAMLVASPRAMKAREALTVAPTMSVDWHCWLPVMRAYEERRPAYFATPATGLIRALAVGLGEILGGDDDPARAMSARFALHERGAAAFRRAWRELGLTAVPQRPALLSNTLSALYYPAGVGPELLGEIAARGVVVAGGLHPELAPRYFRVGHMGHVLTRPDAMRRGVRAIGEALAAKGAAVDVDRALAAMEEE